MKETRFISQNKEKWRDAEELLDKEHKNPGKLSDLFVQVVDDLSYSRTYYPNRSVRVYLNKIARQYFTILYSHQREHKNRFMLFWLDELPQVILHCKIPLLVSLITFLFAVGIGIGSSMKDPQFASSILGPGYVEMTKENISKGDPMAVYKKGHEVDMFLGITLNNLMVAFRTYVFGIFFSIGTLAILLYNGIMVGCFQFFFIERGLFVESSLTIWLHGTLEISSIILAGGAGLTMGSGLIFPGTYSRLEAFQISAIRSLKLMLGITPVFVVAAIIESFLTRYTEAPDAIRLLLILLSATFIIGYFVVYPWMKSKKGFLVPLPEVKLHASHEAPILTSTIKNNGEILKDSFISYRQLFTKIIGWIAVISVAQTVLDLVLEERFIQVRMVNEWWVNFIGKLFYAMGTPQAIFILSNAVGSALIIYRITSLIDKDLNKQKILSHMMSFVQTTIIISLMYVGLWGIGGWGVFLLLVGYGFILMWATVQMVEKVNLFDALARMWNLVGTNFGQPFGLQYILLLMCFSFLLILSAPLLYVYTNILQWNFARTDEWVYTVIQFIESLVRITAFNMIIPLMAASQLFLYYSLTEQTTADGLKQTIASLANKYQKKKNR
jgi:uncharacterized membrane protein SpoIIM required for sporulation